MKNIVRKLKTSMAVESSSLLSVRIFYATINSHNKISKFDYRNRKIYAHILCA